MDVETIEHDKRSNEIPALQKKKHCPPLCFFFYFFISETATLKSLSEDSEYLPQPFSP